MAQVSGTVVPLSCACQTYGWGKIGEQSQVAQLMRAGQGFTIDNNTPYAELWMGTHKSGPSKISNASDGGSVLLGVWIQSNSFVLGEAVVSKFGAALPYLFKVLSINKSLSIQAHPTITHAQVLHAERPDVYKDPNHKPEMAIALTKFEALCGFRPVEEILSFFREVDELRMVIGQDVFESLVKASSVGSDQASAVQAAIKACVKSLMEQHPDVIQEHLTRLVQKLEELQNKGEDVKLYLGDLLLRIHSEFPGDVGCFMIYFLNYIQLEPYQSIFLAPNVPHSYISGDIIECMACSDNVVRAGLTPKYKDVETLVAMLDYTPRSIADTMFYPTPDEKDPHVSVYNPPVEDFAVKMIRIPQGTLSEYTIASINGPSIILVVSGESSASYEGSSESLPMHGGCVTFVGCGSEVRLSNISDSCDLLMFQAYCELS